MNAYVVFSLSLSILVPSIIGLLRFNKIDAYNRPIIICFLIALLNELVVFNLDNHIHKNIAANIYVLIEFLLLIWQFQKWGIIKNIKLYWTILGFSFVLWLLTGMLLNEILFRNMHFRVYYSFILVLFSIDTISKLSQDRIVLFKDYRFLVCASMVIFYTYNIIVESFILYKLKMSYSFIGNLFTIKSILNAFVNLIFALAVICIPKKRTFTLPY